VSAKRVVRRATAEEDFRRAVVYYRHVGGKPLAHRFTDAIQATYRLIGRFPGAGSSRYEFEFGFEALRSRLVRGFPYIVFYSEGPNEIQVWRVLHAERDTLAELGDTDLESDP